MPKVSVIMNCYNGAEYVRAAIESVYAQTFADWEIIFWDNASTDDTAQIARSFGDRVRYFRGVRNVPLGQARRLAMAEAAGEWIGFLDSDDLWYPWKLERQIQALEAFPGEAVLCYAGVREQLMDGTRIRDALPRSRSGDIFAQQLVQFDINMVTPLLNKARLREFGLTFDDRIRASEEYNLFMRLLAKGPACVVDECLGVWTIRPGSLTDRSIGLWASERRLTLQMLEEENPGISSRHKAAFGAAASRAAYYEARDLIAKDDYAGARAALRSVMRSGPLYAALYALSHAPWAWRIVHDPVTKRRLGQLVSRFLG